MRLYRLIPLVFLNPPFSIMIRTTRHEISVVARTSNTTSEMYVKADASAISVTEVNEKTRAAYICAQRLTDYHLNCDEIALTWDLKLRYKRPGRLATGRAIFIPSS
jgi:hypothetical protein